MVGIYAVRSGEVRMRTACAELDVIVTEDDLRKMWKFEQKLECPVSEYVSADTDLLCKYEGTLSMIMEGAVLMASAALALLPKSSSYSIHGVSLNTASDLRVPLGIVDVRGGMKDARYKLSICVTFSERLPPSHMELVALDKSFSREVKADLMSTKSTLMCKKMASALSGGPRCQVTLPGGTLKEELDLLLSELERDVDLTKESIYALGAYKLADFFELKEAAQVLAAMVPITKQSERDAAHRVTSIDSYDYLKERWIAAESKAVEEMQAKEEQALKNGVGAAVYVSDTPERVARLNAVVASLTGSKRKAEAGADVGPVKKDLRSTFEEYDDLDFQELRKQFKAAKLSLGRKTGTRENYVAALKAAKAKEAAKAGGSE